MHWYCQCSCSLCSGLPRIVLFHDGTLNTENFKWRATSGDDVGWRLSRDAVNVFDRTDHKLFALIVFSESPISGASANLASRLASCVSRRETMLLGGGLSCASKTHAHAHVPEVANRPSLTPFLSLSDAPGADPPLFCGRARVPFWNIFILNMGSFLARSSWRWRSFSTALAA